MERQKTKIMVITQSEGGGLRRHLVDLLTNLDKDIFEIYFVYNSRKGDIVFKEWLKYKCQNIVLLDLPQFERQISIKNDLIIFFKIRQLIKKINPEVVHTHSSKAGVLGRIAAKSLRVKKIFYTPHAYSFLSNEFSLKKRNMYRMIEHILSRYMTTKTFNVSNSEKNAAIEANIDSPEKFEVITNALPEVELLERNVAREKLNIPYNQKAIVNLARITHQKNPNLFIEIANKFLAADIHFYWIGEGQPVKNIPENVHFLGNVNEADLYLKAFDAYLSTSLYEGLSYSLLEAARAELPIVATEVPGNIDMKDIYQNIHYFMLDNSYKAINIINNVIDNADSQYEYSIDENKNFENMISTIQNFYLGK